MKSSDITQIINDTIQNTQTVATQTGDFDSNFEIAMICVAIIVVIVVLVFQIISYRKTKGKIKQLESFFPQSDKLKRKDTSITKSILESSTELRNFIINTPEKHISIPHSNELDDSELPEEGNIEYFDVSIIKHPNDVSQVFREVVYDTNSYLCKNVGTSADFSILQDICERKIETLENQISNSTNVPLYLGLAGTFVGIITGITGIVFNVDELFSKGNMDPLKNLLLGVVIAMTASFVGLILMIINSAINYKRATALCEKNKNGYYDFLRRELMPTLSNSMASSLNSLKGVLGEFVGKFGHNLDAYTNSAELLNDNIEKQHLLLVEINKMKEKEIAVGIAGTLNGIKEASDSLRVFRDYQNDLNDTIEHVGETTGKIEELMQSFNDFSSSLKVVVQNQNVANELQTKFMTAIEKHFPTDSDSREMYRKQFDLLTSDAKSVSEELNKQLKSSTEYVRTFVDDNKSVFGSLTQINEVVDKLIEYTNVQSTCYKDLKDEIENLRKEQIKTQQNSAQLNLDLLKAVREMIEAVKSIKN